LPSRQPVRIRILRGKAARVLPPAEMPLSSTNRVVSARAGATAPSKGVVMLITNALVRSLAAVGLLVSASTSQATITVYTSLAAFTAAVHNPGTDTFADVRLDLQTFGPLNRAAGGYGYVATTEPNNSFYGAGSAANPSLSTNVAQDTMTFSGFTGGVAALGGTVYGTNLSGAFTSGDIVFMAADTDGSVSRTITGATLGSFLGFVSSTGSLGSASLWSVQAVGGDFLFPTIDNLVLGATAVPEPSSYALMLAGMGIVGFTARRRRAD
jgi:hypothetical protein